MWSRCALRLELVRNGRTRGSRTILRSIWSIRMGAEASVSSFSHRRTEPESHSDRTHVSRSIITESPAILLRLTTERLSREGGFSPRTGRSDVGRGVSPCTPQPPHPTDKPQLPAPTPGFVGGSGGELEID